MYECGCHDSEEEHQAWFEKEKEYWKWYFGAQLKHINDDMRINNNEN